MRPVSAQNTAPFEIIIYLEPHKIESRRSTFISDKMIRINAVLLGFAAVTLASSIHASLRGSPEQEPSSSEGTFPKTVASRSLVTNDFIPLACNNQYAPCIPWTAKFGTKSEHNVRLFVDCGECIVMDHPGPFVVLGDGIDIRGKLQIIRKENDSAVTIKSTMVNVQGELEMSATKAIDGKPLIKFIMEGEENKSFTPIQENSEACGGSDCSVGKKAITVAGGKVDSKCRLHEVKSEWTWHQTHALTHAVSCIFLISPRPAS